ARPAWSAEERTCSGPRSDTLQTPMRHIVWIVGLLAAGAVSAVTPAEAQVGARIWVDGQPDYFRRGDRMTVNFSVSDDSYVAVVHIDTEGRLDFVFPRSPLDNEYVRGGIVQRISPRGSVGSWT